MPGAPIGVRAVPSELVRASLEHFQACRGASWLERVGPFRSAVEPESLPATHIAQSFGDLPPLGAAGVVRSKCLFQKLSRLHLSF